MRNTNKVPIRKEINLLKKRAKKIKRALDLSHTQALEKVAKEIGFPNWHHLTMSIEKWPSAEWAFRHGCIIAMDAKDSYEFKIDSGLFIDDNEIWDAVEDDLFKRFEDELIDAGEQTVRRRELMDEYEIHELFRDDCMNYRFYQLTDISSVKSVHDVLKLVRKCSFWMPQYLWFRGQYFDTYSLPAEDENGNVIGMRF